MRVHVGDQAKTGDVLGKLGPSGNSTEPHLHFHVCDKPDPLMCAGNRVVVLSDGLWRRRFGGTPDIVGRTIAFDDGAYEIVGVMPPDVSWDVAEPGETLRPSEIKSRPWMRFRREERLRDPGGRDMSIRSIARLKPGVSIEQAQAQMDQIAAALEKANPCGTRTTRRGCGRSAITSWARPRSRGWSCCSARWGSCC